MTLPEDRDMKFGIKDRYRMYKFERYRQVGRVEVTKEKRERLAAVMVKTIMRRFFSLAQLTMVIAIVFLLAGCGSIYEDKPATEGSTALESTMKNLREMGYEPERGDEAMTDYISIDMETAKAKFEAEGDYIILDVRRADEFAGGHIPGAINVANEDIIDKEPTELPDKNQTIYVYCRSGNRSKQASSKLAAMGYTNIIEFGGIIDWTGGIEK